MAVYKFRVEIDEVEDLLRDIEILPEQTFKEFHDALMKYFEIKKKKPASFFISNDKWQKTKEISLGFEGTVDNSTDGNKESIGKFINKKQKQLIYYNEATPNLTYCILLVDEIDEALRSKYPVCVKSVGSATLMSTAVDELFSDNSRVDSEDTENDEEGQSEGGGSDEYGSESESSGGGGGGSDYDE